MPDNSIIDGSSDLRRETETLDTTAAPDFAALLDICPYAVIVLDRGFHILYANAQAIAISHLGPDFLGKCYWDIRADTRGTVLEENFLRAMHDRETRRFEFFYPRLDLWVDVQLFPQPTGLAVFYRDITADRQVEQSRAATVTQLQQVYDATPDSILIVDRSWRYTFANRNAIELLNSGPLVGEDMRELFPEALGEPYLSNYLRTMDQRVPTEFETYYPDPLNAWFRITARPHADDSIILFFSNITARKRAEGDRDRAAAALGQVLDVTSDAIISLDFDYNFTFLNRRAQELLSPAGDPLGKNLWEQFPGTVYPDSPYVAKYHRAMVDRLPGTFDAFYPDPLNLWLRIEARPAPDGIIIFFRDITADRLAHEALRDSENRYRILTDLNPQFIWMGAADGRISYANQRFLEFIGPQHAPDDAGSWINAFDPTDRHRVLRVWGASVESGTDYDIEARLIRNEDGASRWFSLRASPVRDENGAVLQWLGVAIDIHDSRTFAATLHQKQLETERQRAELESIYENTPVGLALFDPVSFRYLRINDELARMIGLPKDQIIGRSVLDIASGVASIGQLFRQVATGQPVRDYILEGELSSRPGDRRTWNVNYFPVYDKAGNLAGITTASLEVTQQKRTEAALVQSEKLAAVGRLASSISHEINNPLEAITNLLYLVSTDPGLPPELKVYVNMAQSELSRVSQIATQTLRFHRQAVRPTAVTAAQLVNAVLNLYQGRLSNSGIQVETSYTSATRILCFENDIRQVLNNLIANAIDAMRTGGRLLARAHDTTDIPTGRRGVRITVADTGHGMSSATLNHLFEPFFTTKDLNGTGLGLWISHGIIQRHKGRLEVRSSQHPVHHGTIFSLFLPTTPD
jgi:PAS domain S-box-containing protein